MWYCILGLYRMQSSGGVTLSPVSLSHYSFVSNTNKKRRGKKNPCCSLCVIQIWRGKKREKGDIKKRGKAAGEMREWIMRGLTGRVAGTAERCDSTEEEWETDLGLICISNSPNIQPAMPETCWFALYSSSSVSSLSLSRSHFISISIFPDLMQVFLGGIFYLSCRLV